MTADLHDPRQFRTALRSWLDGQDLTPPEPQTLESEMVQFARVQRALYDADFGRYGWPAFNVADSAIVIGAGLILLDSLLPSQRATTIGEGR